MLHKTQTYILWIVKVSFLKYNLVVLKRIYALDYFTGFFFILFYYLFWNLNEKLKSLFWLQVIHCTI